MQELMNESLIRNHWQKSKYKSINIFFYLNINDKKRQITRKYVSAPVHVIK